MRLYELFKKKVFHIDLGLDRIKKALNELGNPQENFKSILISGTNGKGSTSAFLESLLRYSNFKVGLFTSPHLIDERERWQINREYINETDLKKYISLIKPLINKYNLTYFEASTIIAFLYFSDKNVDFAVLEVGLGGRYDATNVVNPELSIITNVSLDHTHILGNTLEKIAFEKLGIARQNKPLVLGSNQKELLNWIYKLKIEDFYYPPQDYSFKTYFLNKKQKVDYKFKDKVFYGLETKLIGDRQGNNLSTALTGYLILMEKLGKNIYKEKIYRALANTEWKGRMEIVSENPFIVIDGAHNQDALKKSFLELKKLFPNKNIKTIISFMKDKNFRELVEIANLYSEELIFVEIPFDRGVKIKDINKDFPDLKYLPSINEIKRFIQTNKGDNNIFFITGSLYFIGEVLKFKNILFS